MPYHRRAGIVVGISAGLITRLIAPLRVRRTSAIRIRTSLLTNRRLTTRRASTVANQPGRRPGQPPVTEQPAPPHHQPEQRLFSSAQGRPRPLARITPMATPLAWFLTAWLLGANTALAASFTVGMTPPNFFPSLPYLYSLDGTGQMGNVPEGQILENKFFVRNLVSLRFGNGLRLDISGTLRLTGSDFGSAINARADGAQDNPNTITIRSGGLVESRSSGRFAIPVRIAGNYNRLDVHAGGRILSTHNNAVFSYGDNTTINVAGTITTEGRGAPTASGSSGAIFGEAIIIRDADNANINIMAGGLLETTACLTDGMNGASTCPANANPNPSNGHGINISGENATITLGTEPMMGTTVSFDGMNEARNARIITLGATSHGIVLAATGAAMSNIGRITTYADSLIRTMGAGAHGIVIGDTPGDSTTTAVENTAAVRLDLGGHIEVTGANAVGLQLSDTNLVLANVDGNTGNGREIRITGQISATGMDGAAIRDSSGTGIRLLLDGAMIRGDVALGAGDDELDVTGSTAIGTASARRNIRMGDDNDLVSFRSSAMSYLTDIDLGDGNDTLALNANLTISGSLMGGAGTDTLQGYTTNATWTLDTTSNRYQADGQTAALPFAGFEGLYGGNMRDTFNISVSHTGNLSGRGGADVFNLTGGVLMGNIEGGDNEDTLTLTGTTAAIGSNVSSTITRQSINMGDGDDEITFNSTATSYLTDIDLGADNDTLTLSANIDISGSLTGGAGTDTLIGYAADATWTLARTANSGANTYATGTGTSARSQTFAEFQNLTGGSMNDAFTLTAAHAGNLDGGAGDDRFTLTAAHTGNLNGGAGDDTLILNTGGSLTGTVALGDDMDTLSYGNRSTTVAVTLTSRDATGFAGAATATGGFSGVNALTAGSATATTDALTGYNTTATWTLGRTGNSYADASHRLTFTGFENLTGGAMMDTFEVTTSHTGDLNGREEDDVFTLSGSARLQGRIIGHTGSDTLRVTDSASSRGDIWMGTGNDRVIFNSSAASYINSLTLGDGADELTLGAGVNLATGSTLDGGSDVDTLTGYTTTATWILASDGNSYQAGGQTLSFSAFENLIGSAMVDTFNVSVNHTGNLNGGDGDDAFTINTGGSLTGTVALGAGSDSFSYGNRSTIVAVTLTGSDADGFAGSATDTGGFTGVNTLTAGSAMDDALTGYNVAATWTVATAGNTYGTGTGQNARSLTFSGFENLTGGAMADTFEIRTNHRGNINSSAGDDIVALYGSVTLTGVVNLGAGGGDFLQFNNLGSGDFTLTGSDATGFSGTHSAITGGFRGVNSLAANDPPTGGAVHNLIGLNRNATWTSDSQGIRYAVTEGTTTRSLGLFHFEQFTGGTGNDTFNVGFNDDIDINGGAGDDRFNLSGLITGNLTGGAMMDTFTISTDHTGNLDGGAGDDSFTLSAGTLTGNLTGGDDNDTVTMDGDARLVGDITLGTGDDTLTFASADVRFFGLADGGPGMDTLNGLQLFTEASATTIFRFRNFETVNGETELLTNLPVVARQETMDAAGTIISYTDGQPPPPPPAPQGTGTGTGTTPPPTGGTATPPPPSPTDFAVLAAAYCEATGTACQPATATRPATVTPTPPALPDPTTLPDEPARAAARDRFQSQVESYVYVDPTGPSVQASAVGALTTTINTLISQRLSAYRRAARPPVQVAATALLPGMLARGEDPLIWGELFASDRQRGRDGRTLSYSHEYRGVLFGAEQRYGQEAVLGLMLGYADADVSTHITALNVETGSLFGGVYGRLDLAGLAVDVGLNLGYEEHDNQRFIPQQRQTAETSTHSFFINPSLTVSQSYRVEALSGRATFRLTPSLSMSYTAAFYGDYTERGAAGFNLSVDSRTAHNLTTRLQLGGDWALPKSNSGLGLRLGLQSRFTDSSDFEGTLSGASFSYASDADKSVHSLYVGVDGRHELRDNLKLLVDVEYNHDVGEVSERALSGIVRLEYAY